MNNSSGDRLIGATPEKSPLLISTVTSDDSMISATPEKNPLLIRTVITTILEMLPLSEIKTVRLICREWNAHAETLLREKAKIVFNKDFRTSDFFEYYSDSRLSALPFTAFKFEDYDGRSGYLKTDLDDFFNKCGKNIKSFELYFINIYRDKDRRDLIREMNISHWIASLSDKLYKLRINVPTCRPLKSTRFTFNMENLAGVKSLSLLECNVIVNSSNINCIAPSEIALVGVTFLNESGNKLSSVVLNDFVDFSKCSIIKLYKLFSDTALSFDMSKDTVNAKKVDFSKIQMLNSRFSKIKADSLRVFHTSSETMKMQMKELEIGHCSSINLTDLPERVEKLKIKENLIVPNYTAPLNLPNLQYLHLAYPIREDEGGLRLFEIISVFKNCYNLVDVHLEQGFDCEGFGDELKIQLDVAWLPKSVKRLKMTKISEIVFLGDSHHIDVDVLLLDASMNSKAVEILMEKIKPKILVKIVTFARNNRKPGRETTDDFISFIQNNTQLEKIVINTLNGLVNAGSYGKKSFLQFVGEKSQYYEFNNQIGKAISMEEFEKYYDINYMSRVAIRSERFVDIIDF